MRFGQIKKKLGWKTGDAATAGALNTPSFTSVNKVTKKKAFAVGSARAKRISKASALGEDAQDDEEGTGDVDMKTDSSDEIKHEDEEQGYVEIAHNTCNTSQDNVDKERLPTCWRR